jgi:hypothetical protein
MKKIYWLSPNVKFDDRLLYHERMQPKTKLCKMDSSHTVASRWTRPLKIVGNPKPIMDFEWTVYSDLIIDQNVVSDLKTSGFSGFDLNPVEFYSTTGTPFGRQSFELKVTGWGGMASAGSGIRIVKKCSFCGSAVYSSYANKEELFDIDKWDGSDLFLIWPLPRYIFITDEVADFITEAGYSGVNIFDLSKLPNPIAGTFTPGHIKDWYNEERAKNIIKELGN